VKRQDQHISERVGVWLTRIAAFYFTIHLAAYIAANI
jgi:hypothetical protein